MAKEEDEKAKGEGNAQTAVGTLARALFFLPGVIFVPPLFTNLPWFVLSPFLVAGAFAREYITGPWHNRQTRLLRESLKGAVEESKMHVVVLGGGISGITAAIRLKALGIPYTLLEKSTRLGGTWWLNQYPGVACDVPGIAYSWSFEQNPNWTNRFVSGKEILAYIDGVVEKYGIMENCRLGVHVESAKWNEEKKQWVLSTSSGQMVGSCLISGVGGLHIPNKPQFPGQETFQGDAFHSSEWKSDFDATNKRIAVVGSAASAVQLVPELAKTASKVVVLQRSPNWVFPRPDGKFLLITKKLFALCPAVQRFCRWTFYLRNETMHALFFGGHSLMAPLRWYLHQAVRTLLRISLGKELAAKSTPDYQIGCRRVLVSNDWYPTLKKPNVELITGSNVKQVTPSGITVTSDEGERHLNVDAIVYATGYLPFAFSRDFDIKGSGKLSLGDLGTDIEALHGITAPEFPNLFMLVGPNTGLGHNSIVFMIECQMAYTEQCLVKMLRNRWTSLEPTQDATKSWNQWLYAQFGGTSWSSGCRSWYANDKGRLYTLYPKNTISYWWNTLTPSFNMFKTQSAE